MTIEYYFTSFSLTSITFLTFQPQPSTETSPAGSVATGAATASTVGAAAVAKKTAVPVTSEVTDTSSTTNKKPQAVATLIEPIETEVIAFFNIALTLVQSLLRKAFFLCHHGH